ncbi:response regulator transcription factor [Corynebacterium cystitidis]|uniref:response regulator transcription factor n=1 Tax=Corynebacterium cystitidis TaxID=35757 RepID=UPI00211F38FD|nr:response regulator transcription factor [Corynebacterium cystitidis]
MIRFALVDDEVLVADSLATLLSLEDDLQIAGVFYSAEDFQHSSIHADVLVTDLQLGGDLDGIALARQTDLPVVLVTSHAQPAVLKRALAAGLAGILPKTSSSDAFADAIRSVHAGRRYIDPELAALTIAANDSPLTEREAELLSLAGEGATVEEIAHRAHLALGTTRNYLSSAMSKVGAANRFQAFTLARERGWI